MKKIVAATALQALLAFFAAGAFCQKWTEYEESLFKQTLQVRLESRKIDGNKAALDWIEKKTLGILFFNKRGERKPRGSFGLRK